MSSTRSIALGYGRKSVVRRKSDEIGVDKQRKAIERLADERGLELDWYEDAQGHRSGRFERTRPNYLRLLSRLETDPNVQTVIFYELDRAGRSVIIIDKILKLCQSRGITLISIRDGIDTSRGIDANVTSQIQMRAVFSEYYANDVADRMRSTAAYYRDELAIPWGMRPFGMTRSGEGRDARFEPDPVHGATAKSALTWYAAGLSYDATSNKLNDHQLRHLDRYGTPKRFTREAVRSIIGNVLFYAGYAITGRRFRSKDSRIALDGEGTYLARYVRSMHALRSPAITPLITDELASSVIERRYKNQVVGRKGSGWVALLTPIAYWNDKKLRAGSYPYGNFYLTRSSGIWINGDVADAELVRRLSGIQFPPELRAIIRRGVTERTSDASKRKVQADIDEFSRQMEILLDLHMGGQVQREHYNTRYAELDRALREARAKLSREDDVDRLMDALGDLASAVEIMTPAKRKQAIQKLFERVNFSDTGEIERIVLKEWTRQAFGEIVFSWRNHAKGAPGEPSPQIWHGDTEWFLRLAA